MELGQVVNRSVFSEVTQSFSCNNFFCDQTMYNLLYYNSFYENCNPSNCQNTICAGYNCIEALNNPNYFPSVNSFYSCYPNCVTNMADAPVPSIMTSSFIVAILAACLFGLACFLALVYGIAMAICYRDLDIPEKIACAITVFMPGLKYTMIR